MDDNIKKLHQALIDDGYDDVGTEQEFRDYVSDSKNVATLYNALSEAGYDNFKDQKSLETYLSAKAPVAQKPSTPQSSGQSVSSKGKKQTQYPQEVIDAFNSPDNKPGNFKDLAQLNDEYQRGELKKPSLISQALGMMPKVDAGNIGREQKMDGMITNMLLGDNMQHPQDNNQQVQQAVQENAPATEQTNPTVKDVDATTGAAPVQQVDAIYNKYVGKGDALSETMYDLMASGQAQNQEEAQNMAMGAMNRAANRLAQRTTDEFVSKLDDTVEGVDEAVMNGWHSHAVQDKLKKLASQYGIMNSVAVDENGQYITQTNGYDQFINGMVKPAMVESLVKKYGENYRKAAEDLATRLYSNDEVIQNQLMNQDIDEALSSVISKYVNPSVVDEYNKAQEAGSKAFNEGMEGSQNIPASLRLGTAIASQYEANQAKDPQKTLNTLQKKFNGLYKNPQFLNDMSNAAFKVMQRYGMNGTLSGNPKQFKPMIDDVLKAQLNQLEVKNMIPKGSAEYIMNTGLGNTIVGKITRKAMQTDYQNWLEDIANQQYQPGFWERVGSGALTFAGDAWSYWLPGAAGGKVTKSMLAKAEGRLASDLMAKGMEAKMAERAAKVLIGKSKGMALKTGAAHGAVTFGGQSAISKPIDEIYRTGQLDENGKVYNPSVGKILANTLGEVAKQSAVGAIMQGGTIANMIGKGRGLATNILADVGGKVVDSSIMTGQQILERMAHDPNFKPTGKDAAESFLESLANLTSIGLPGMVGKYARFKDAKEFNRKFDFNDRDIAELKRLGYDDLRDAFEKLGINGYRADGEGVQMMGQLTDKYMNLMNDKSVPEVLKAKMMAVVEGKRPSSFSPVIDSIIVQPMDNDGKVYLETLNKDGGIIDRKEYSSLEEAQKAEKKLDFEKSLNITSEYEKAYHTDALQDRLNTVYEQARDKYAAGEQLNDEDKAAIYLHQNASAIGGIMQKQQKGMELTEQEQQMVNSYRHFYDSAFENSPIMKEYVRTFEDSQGVEHGTLRKALEGDGKSRTAEQQKLVEEYQKQLYNDIVLKREMNDAKEQMNQNLIEGQRELPGATQEGGASAENAEATAEKPVDASVSSDVPPTEPPTPPVGGETPTNAEGAPSVENGSSPSDATTASNESKSDAYVMGQNAYQNGDAEGLKAIDHNDDVSKARLKRAFADNEAMMDVVVKAYEEGKDMEQFVAQSANSMTTAQQDAVRKYVEAQDAKKGVYDALQHADDGYGDALKELLWTYQTEDGNIVPATLTTGQQVFLKKANEYGGGFVVVPDEDGNPAIKQVSSADIKEVGTSIPMDDYINQQVTEQVDARYKQFRSQFDGSGFKRGDIVSVSLEAGDEPSDVKIVGYTEDGRVILTDTDVDVNSQIDPNKLEFVTKDEFNAWRQNAIDTSVGAELDAEDAQRANDDAAKAEADKKQRYNEGIVGLGMGQPDYSSKDTEPKVAAEYLQEQFGNDHGKLMNLISGSRSDIKEQLDNKRKAASEYEDWLSLNADLDPEKAQKVENDLALVNEQISDLETRYKNWNAIRKEVMTPEEARTLKNERKAEIEKAGVDDSVGSPSDEREVAVLDNKELKKQYPTMDEASNYIASERKRIYHIQNDEVQPQIDNINEALEQYMNGDIDYSADQLKELNTTKAQLEARQANLSASAKDLKAQDKLLNTLYSAENKEERAKAMEELTPSEQRKVLVADAFKKNDLGAIKEIYKDASIDVMDLTPQTLEEAVSQALHPHSLNAESLQAELGKDNFKYGIGKGYDSNKFNYLLAKKGTGLSVNEFAVRVYNDLPINLQDMGYTDQDVRNALLDMFKSYDSVKEMRNVALMNRIAAAEDELSSEEEYYEAQKEREIIERQAEIENYNSYIKEKALSLPSESELDHIYGLEYDRMMEIEDREREYKQYVKSILPELADYDDRSNEEGYGGGSSLGSDSSRRGVDEGNSQGEEVGNGEASSESEIGEGSDSGRKGRQETGSLERGEGSTVRGSHLPQEASFGERLKGAIAETEPNPSEAQKKAGNYKKGHLSFGGYDFTVETPKGTTRSGKDEQGKPWSVTMHDTYGYILGKIGVDGDHIDMFINDAADLDTFDGNVCVIDQVNPETGEFDEHKVMYGYPSEEAATEAYLANYSKGWKGLGKVTSVPKATFDKWLESSDRKTKPFADYAMIKKDLYQDYFSDMTEEEAREKLLNDFGKMTDGKFFSEIDWDKLKSIYHSFYLRFGDDVDAAKYRKDVHAIWNKAYVTHLKEISKNNAEVFVANLNPFSLKEKINIWKTKEDVDSYVDQNIVEDISNGRSSKDNFLYNNHFGDFYVSLIEKEAKFLAEKNYYLDAALQRYSKEKVPEQEKALRDALIDVIKGSGIEVVTDNKEGQKVLDSIRNVITVYHGAGASFGHFDHSFMGSGEGAQAFGWGTYVTEVPGIANEYSKASSERKLVSPQKLYFKNEEVDSSSYASWMVAYKTLEKYGKDFDEAFNVLEEKHQQYINDFVLVGDSDEKRTSVYSSAIEVLKEEQKNPGSLVFEPAVFEERERNLYVVEIPKDDGDNYLDWDSPMSDVKYKKLSKLLSDKKLLVPANRRGSELYNQLAKSLGSQKNASLMLSSLGFVGIKYPANYRSGGRKDGALNYVIFQEADAKIYEDYKFFRSSDGTIYGFVHDGKIYIDPSIATSEVPIHEYTHIWSRQLRSANPKEWENIISLMKGTTIWDEVKNSNKNLKTDSDIADEVLAIYSGRKGSQRIKDEFNKIIEEDSSLLDKAKAMNAIHKVKQAINKFWKAVTDFLHVHFGSADEVADTVLRDFLNEVNPLKQKSGNEGVKTDGALPFHRDVKEVKPSEMTEAQKVAYDAVSTMLKKAGIPVKVVSNEDMEKVADAQDNLNLAMLLNQPELRFKIKTPEEKQAAENAYNFAKELRPNKWSQYAVVDMSNPNKMPEYYQKQELARKERTYLNRLMWGNYKVFNLDKSFEDNVAGLTGSFPSEFDPYKIDEQTSKKNELKKQIKETEDAYNSTGQERNNYQIQLMKEYMDEHGLASENDIPDDVWSKLNDKAHEKYQDKLDSLFAKYKDLDRQLKAIVQPGVQYLKGKGVVYGYTDGKEIVLNQEHLNPNTPIHEYQHLWRTAAKNMNPELIEHGDKLIMQTQLFADLKQDPNYNHLTDEQICDEAFARLTGEDGDAILEQMAKDAIKENPLDTAKELSVINKLKEWLKKFWYWTLDTFTKWKPEDIKKMTLEDIRNLVLRDLANGVDPRTVMNEKKEGVKLSNKEKDDATERIDKRIAELNRQEKEQSLKSENGNLAESHDNGYLPSKDNLDGVQSVAPSSAKIDKKFPTKAFYLGNLANFITSMGKNADITAGNFTKKLFEGMGMTPHGKDTQVSEYFKYQTDDGGKTTVRLSDHSGNALSIIKKGGRADKGYSIVVRVDSSPKTKFKANKYSNVAEYVYENPNADGLKDIARSVFNLIDTGEYLDLAGANEVHVSPRNNDADKTLAGVHNITEEKLRKALKLGGLANPSLAVIDTNKTGHDNFGEISFIAPSALVDKRTGKTAGTWITDAYTQRYPSVEREMSEKGRQKFNDWVDSLEYPAADKAEIKRQTEDALSNNNAPAWELMYLKEKGIDIKEYDSRIDYRWKEIIRDHPAAEDILSSMQNDPELNEKVTSLAKHAIIHPTWEKVSLEVRRKMYEETGVKASPINPQVRKQTKEIFERDYKPTLLDKDGNPKADDVKKVVEDIVKEHNDTKKYDFYLSKVKASNYVNKNGLYDDYIKWQENKLDEFGTKNRIFRGYKNDGSRKYVPETLENVSKAMREDADGQTNGSEYTSFGSFIAKLASRVDSTSEMRANKDKLSSNEDKEKFYEKWESMYYDLAKSLYNDVFYGEQRLHDIVSQPDPKKYAKKEYGITLTPSFMKKLDSLKNAVQNELKSAYFETKFNRPVHLNEFVAAVVPNDLGEDVRKGLEESGLSLFDYDPEKEGDRSRAFNEAINSNHEIRFHRVTEVKSPIMEQKLQKHPDSLMKAGTYFSGGGLVEEGLKGIIDPVVAVEYDRKISGVYRNNFGQHIVTADVRDVDPKELVKHIDGEVEYFHASPVCKNYSQAKSNSGEVELDKETAKSTADFIDAVKPRVVTIENVKGYKDSEAMNIITKSLDKNGYTWDSDVYNAADYGGYTNRERLIVRAVKDGELPEKPKKQPRKGGWLEAVEDILPTLTVKESGVAPWMDARLKADGIDWQKVEKPLYVMGSAYADGKIPHAYGDEILPTLRTKSGDVIIMPGGKVLRADGRVLARITGLGDDYKLPKTESLAHTIIGNGIPVQLTQGVIAPLLNKDDLSGRNVLARLGSSIFKNNWDADKQKQVSDRVVNTANKLGGAEATVYTSVDEVPDAYLSDVKNGATGWYDPTTHTVHVYLPNCADANEAERTVLHEKIGHEGMEVLLGGEDGVRKFANFVYRSVGKDVRGKIIDFANKYDPDWKNPDRMNIGTQEYIARLAEEGPKSAEDFTLWTKIKHYLIRLLKKLGIRVPGLLNDKDLRYYLMKAGKALHVWDEMPQEKQETMMKQASNAEIKDALSDGAGKGKPRQKKGESTIQYMKRVQEWRKWQNAREDKENKEPPMFYDIDKDEAGKKEWAQLNKDWRERHHLVGEVPTGMPIRMEGEEDDAYMNRIHEYEKWQAAMKDQEDPLPDMFAFEKKKQEEVKRKYEDWLAKHDLLEQQQADLDLYEGKIYPAETNPKADALEQQVMQDLAEVTSTDVSKEGAAKTVKHAVIHRRKNMEEASADDAIYINDVKNRIEKMADSGAFDKLLSEYQGKPNKAEKLAEAIPYIIEAPRRLRDLARDLNATGAFDKGHIHIQPADVEAIQPFVADLIAETGKKHTELKDGKEVEVYDDPQAVSEVASKMAQAINANHQGEEGFVPIDGTDILSEHVLPLVKQQIVPKGIDYKNLSPEMKSTIDSIRDWYNYTYDWLKDNHTLKAGTGYNVDYVNHIWDKEKSDKQAYAMYVENRQRTKSPNEKPRTISTLMEGISVGLVPKTTDITKMMAYYSRSNIEAWANKTMLQEVSGLNVIERNEKGEVISTDPLLSSSAPFNLEQYKYFEIPGVGPVWVYNVSTKQVKVKNPITDKEKVLYSEASAGDRFGVVFETYQSSPFWKGFDTLASSSKKLELGFSSFHAGALTEVYMVQNMVEFGPKKAMANFMKYIFVDTMKNHELPCFANPQDFQEAATHLVKFGATNDYAAADVQNMFDNMRDAMIKVQEKLKDGNKISGTVAKASIPFKVASQMLSLINKGMDVALWDFLHDGLKLATYRMRADKTKERAKKKGWTEEELSRALDEDGQFVNDMFGGQHWDVLGASHRTLRYAGRALLSPDWNASTTRHFLALTGYGSIWNEATFENFKQYYKRLKHKELTPEDEGRRSRQISALLCYGIGFMVFYEGIANGINAAFRALDEEKERKKAEEMRKTNPNYRSMYELAYGDEGMKWYDYLMRGNSLGQQSKIFLGRYEDGTEMYVRHGKQFREVPEYLFNHKGELEFPGPMVQRMIGKANPMVRMTLDDINYLSDFQASHADQEIQRKYGKTIGLLYKDALYWAPFLIPSQENKEFKAVDFFFPSSKGFSPWKAQSYFKDFILSGDMEGVVMTYQSCQRNGIDPEAQIKAAIGSVKALESAEMSDGVTSLQEASKRFDAAKSITEKKKMRQKMKKFLSQSDYKAFTQKEALDMVQGYLNGDEDLKEMEKAESKYLMKAKAEDVTEDWRIQNVWNGTMETYQEYQRLKDIDKAKANAFKNSKTNKRLFAARKAISAARRKMNKAKKQMDGTNDAAKLVEIRNTRKELLKTLNGME